MRKDGIILKSVSVDRNIVTYNFEVRGCIKNLFATDKYFIEYAEDMSEVPISILTIPFVSEMLPIIWLSDTVVWVEELDRTYYNCISQVKAAYQRLYEHVSLKGNVVAAKMPQNKVDGNDCVMLFGGGIDSHCTLQRIKQFHPTLITIQGWYHNLDEIIPASTSEIDYTKFVAKQQKVDSICIKSNFAVLVNKPEFDKRFHKILHDSLWSGFQHSMEFISIASAYCFKHNIPTIYIASSIPMGEYEMCGSHVTTDSEFRFATNGQCIHDGSELTRQDKVHVIIENCDKINGKYPLKVCSFNDKNCCDCDKCFRSILGIVAEGGNIENFGFHIEGSLKEHWEKIFKDHGQKFNIRGESSLHWPAIRRRMLENYDNILYKDFADWFMNFDFLSAQKKALKRYYRQNFREILSRKIKQHLTNNG